MKKNKLLLFLFTLLTFILFIIYFFLNHSQNKQITKKVSTIFEEISIENNLQNINHISSLYLPIDGVNVVGFIKIEKINFEGLVYEGTSQDVLKKGVGHFECSPLTYRQYLLSCS